MHRELEPGLIRISTEVTMKLALAIAISFFAVSLVSAQSDNSGFGFDIGKTVSAKDVGLPLYPGSHEAKKEDGNDPAVQMNGWLSGGGSS